MRQQLINYVELLFAGARNADDIKQEILQNTLDRYDDLISQGKSEEAAYTLAISGIGDISELLEQSAPLQPTPLPQQKEETPLWKKVLRAIGILLYIICPIPLFILAEIGMSTLGLCGTLAIVAVATALMILSGGSQHGASAAARTADPSAPAVKAPRKRALVWGIVVILLAAALLVGLFGNSFLYFGIDDGNYITGDGSVAAAEVEKLQIDWVSGSIKIMVADTDTITFSETGHAGENNRMAYSKDGSTLSIRYSKPAIRIGFISLPTKDLTITVPKNWICSKLELDGASMDVSLDGLRVTDIDIDGASNDIHVTGAFTTLSCDGASCDITAICTDLPKQIDLDGTSCQMALTLPNGCGFAVEMDGVSCDFESKLPYAGEKGHYRYGNEYCKIDVDGVSCELSIAQSAACTHNWDSGSLLRIPGSGELQIVYTCSLCGSTKSENIDKADMTVMLQLARNLYTEYYAEVITAGGTPSDDAVFALKNGSVYMILVNGSYQDTLYDSLEAAKAVMRSIDSTARNPVILEE